MLYFYLFITLMTELNIFVNCLKCPNLFCAVWLISLLKISGGLEFEDPSSMHSILLQNMS
jgi:hypothetical protein